MDFGGKGLAGSGIGLQGFGPAGGILCVDDDETVLLYAEALLGRRFPVHTASSGLDGLQKVMRLRPEWILLDYDMPGMDGIQFMLTVRELGLRPGFILLTGMDAFDINWETLHVLGLKGCLKKPLDPDKLQGLLGLPVEEKAL